MIKLIAVLLLMVSALAQAQSALHTDLPLNYLEQTDSQARNQPLVIFLHGSGSNEDDLFDLKDQLPGTYTYLSARAPIEVGPDSYQWFQAQSGNTGYDGVTADLNHSEALISEFIVKATAKYQTQPEKVFLIGFSQGAMMSYEVALRHPEHVRGIAALSGKILPVLKSQLTPSPRLKLLEVFIGHGSADLKIPYAGGTDAATWLTELSLAPTFHAYPGIGHTISRSEIIDLDKWLQASNRP